MRGKIPKDPNFVARFCKLLKGAGARKKKAFKGAFNPRRVAQTQRVVATDSRDFDVVWVRPIHDGIVFFFISLFVTYIRTLQIVKRQIFSSVFSGFIRPMRAK